MPSVIAEIRDWAKALPYWERAVLDKLLNEASFGEGDYEAALKYLLEDAGLAERVGERPKLQLLDLETPDREEAHKWVILTRLFNAKNVNALVPGQAIEFCPTLTVLYGANGSGKSGYARVLGCAGFTRGDREVLPDVTRPVAPDTVLSADLEVSDGESASTFTYKIGAVCTELSQCYVFDSTSVRAHLTESNTFSFVPGGLSYLTKLSEITDGVRRRLQNRIDAANQSRDFAVAFQGDSTVTDFVAKLDASTDLSELRRLATLSPQEVNKIEELDIEIARLRSQDVQKELAKLSQSIDDLVLLRDRIIQLQGAVSAERAEDVADKVSQYVESEAMARRVTLEDLKSDHFHQIGTDVWRHFAEAAKALAEAESRPAGEYPQLGDYCLLCHQPLSHGAFDMLVKLWEFLKSDAQTRFERSTIALSRTKSALEGVDIDFFNSQLVSYRLLAEQDQPLLEHIADFIAACRARRETLLQIAEKRSLQPVPALPDVNMDQLQRRLDILISNRHALEEKNADQQIAGLSRELLVLRHRQILAKLEKEITTYVLTKAWAVRASRIRGDTKHITSKYKQLFGQLVTDRYIEVFNGILASLDRPLAVTIKTVGRKGQTFKHVAVQVDATVREDMAAPEKVLSEGEKRAVALADFLTEVALDEASSTVILDDPVTSLDLEWRATIAAILVNEARRRQTIVFTHDLPFLYLIKREAEEKEVPIMNHWIRRMGGKPGFVSLNDSPVLEREYRNPSRARQFLAKARNAVGQEQEDLLVQGFDALRATYEAFIVYDMLGDVVRRFEERISAGRLRDIRWDRALADEVYARYEDISRHIGGHLHTDAALRPSPETLSDEIDSFADLRARLRELKRA